jgi:hypothetical protein
MNSPIISSVDTVGAGYGKLLSKGLLISEFRIERSARDSGRALVLAEYGYPKGSPNTNS